jgi:O-antigen/teichoic acid export membrane protein
MNISKSDIKSIIQLVISYLVLNITSIIGAILQGFLVSPELLGEFRYFSYLSSFLFFTHLGIFHATETYYPILIGRSKNEEAIQIALHSFSFLKTITVIIIVLIFSASLYYLFLNKPILFLSLLSQGFIFGSSILGGYVKILYRVNNEFKILSKSEYISSFSNFLGSVFLFFSSLTGLFIKSIGNSLNTLYLFLKLDKKFHKQIRFDIHEILKLIRIGLPRFISSYVITTGLEGLILFLVANFFTFELIGYWSFSWVLFLLLLQFPNTISSYFMPRLISNYSMNKDLPLFKKSFTRIIKFNLIVTSLFSLVSLLMIFLFFDFLFPNYSGATFTLIILVISSILRVFDQFNGFLSTLNKTIYLNFISFLSLFFFIVIFLILFELNFGFNSIALSYLITFSLRTIIITTSVYFIKNEKLLS